MSYEVRDGNMWRVVEINGREGLTYAGSTTEAVADALDVLRAAGWTVERTGSKRYVNGTPGGYKQAIESFVARSPWRQVSDGE